MLDQIKHRNGHCRVISCAGRSYDTPADTLWCLAHEKRIGQDIAVIVMI